MQILPWTDPLSFASAIKTPHWVLLYSGIQTSYSGRYSYLACHAEEYVEGNDFDALSHKLGDSQSWYENAWFGYLGYGLKNTLEALPEDLPGNVSLPHLRMTRFSSIFRFDHEKQCIEYWSGHPIEEYIPHMGIELPMVKYLKSNMSNEVYLQKARTAIDRIHAGDLYQANLTRKFYGEFERAPSRFDIFRALCRVSPAPYSAYLQFDTTSIISSSPELFLKVSENGAVRSRPIKGTAPRSTNADEDKRLRNTLSRSEKDMAENLMIADLMRNDLSRSCEAGSVRVDNMFEVTTHANVHHMSSTVIGKKRKNCTTLDVVKHSFPPGSMTGAPKIRAMELCSELELQSRGVYAGAIGFFDGAGSCELSVVIRTLIVDGTYFEFQVGGGIVADSIPENELQETFYKASGLMKALKIPLETLEAL